jgi:sugar phosphate isomerase/epimerase
MARFAVSEMTTFRWPFEQDLREYREAGVAAIGVWRQKISDFDEATGIELISDSGLAVSSLAWAGGFTGSDGRSHAESIQDGREAIRLASGLHAGCLIVHPGARGGHTHKHARRLFQKAIEKLLPLAEELSVALVIEPMCTPCGAEWTFLSDPLEAKQLVESFDSQWFRLLLDLYHLAPHPQVSTLLADLAPLTSLVQLGDSRGVCFQEQNRCRLGDGTLPVAQMVSILHQAGYAGDFELELVGEDVEAQCYRQLLRESKDRWQDWIAT